MFACSQGADVFGYASAASAATPKALTSGDQASHVDTVLMWHWLLCDPPPNIFLHHVCLCIHIIYIYIYIYTYVHKPLSFYAAG